MSKQTAVEWLHLQLKEWAKLNSGFDTLFEQAKEMEKEQIEDAFQDGKWDWHEHLNGNPSKDLAEYYHENYGSKK
jgi:hypothetical protein